MDPGAARLSPLVRDDDRSYEKRAVLAAQIDFVTPPSTRMFCPVM
jgi:hypothetical protein